MTEEQTPKRMTSLDRKIEASRLRAEAERKTQAVPQSQPTEGLTHLMSTESCNVANQRKPAHGGRMPLDTIDRIADAVEAAGMQPLVVFPTPEVGQGPAAETVAEVIEAAAAGTQPSPEQIKAAIHERERTEAQLRATWERQDNLIRAQQLARKAFSARIADNLTRRTPLMAMAEATEQRDKLSTQITVFMAWLLNHPEIHETVLNRMRDQGMFPHDPASLPPQMGTLMRIALPPPGSKVAALGPGGLRFVVERSDKSVYLVVDGSGV